MTNVLLIRHGDTDSVGRYLSGRAPGIDLNRIGLTQVQHLVDELRRVPLAAVVSSPLERCRQTAEPIAGSHGLTVDMEPAFKEVDFGAWTDRTFADLARDPAWRPYNEARSLHRPPGGESLMDVQHRAVPAGMGLVARHRHETIAVISHGDVIKSMLMFALGMPLDLVHRIEVAPAGISFLKWDEASVAVHQVNGAGAPEGI